MIEVKLIDVGKRDDGTVVRRYQVDIPEDAVGMARAVGAVGQHLFGYVPVDGVTFNQNLTDVKARGADGPLAAQMRTAGLDSALADLAGREG